MSLKNLKHLALLGMTSGLFAGCGGGADSHSEKAATANGAKAPAGDKVAASVQGEEALLSKLDDKHRAVYHSLDAEHKEMALKMAKQSCAGQNECKGLNSCKGSDHSCAGMGSCAGTGSCAWSDSNKMIDVVMKHMAEKRGKVEYK